MKVETVVQSYRGVRCLSCRQPIPLPAILSKTDSVLMGNTPDSAPDHPTRVFSLRCRVCEREKPYGATDIVDFEGAPRARVSRPHVGRPKSLHSARSSRSANC